MPVPARDQYLDVAHSAEADRLVLELSPDLSFGDSPEDVFARMGV